MKKIMRAALTATMLGSLGAAAIAADLAPPPPAPVVVPEVFQPFQIHLDATGVVSQNGGILTTNPGGAFISGGFKASDAVIPELDLSYYFTKNWAVELVCCISYHNLYLDGGSLANTKVGHTLIFPPTLFAQYHITDFGKFQPYVGIGVNYTHYFSTSPNGALLSYAAIRDSWGVAGQVGFDYMLDDHWGLNFNVKKIMMQPHVNAGIAGGPINLTGQADINPWMFSGGITFRFGGAAPAVLAKY